MTGGQALESLEQLGGLVPGYQNVTIDYMAGGSDDRCAAHAWQPWPPAGMSSAFRCPIQCLPPPISRSTDISTVKVHTKLSLILLFITAVFIAGIIALQMYNSRHAAELIQLKINEKNTLFDKILKLETSSLETFVYDFSRSADACSIFMQAGIEQKLGSMCCRLLKALMCRRSGFSP